MVVSLLGCSQTLTGIPSLLISDLGRVQDPVVARALLQIQNFANSIGMLPTGATGSGTANLGTGYPGIYPAPIFWAMTCHGGDRAYIPVWV